MRTSLLTIFFLLSVLFTFAQQPKNVVVEHFTNTRCGICASRNPGFYSNLDNNPDIFHIAYHPSAPYNNCVLNLHNVSGNDGRTNYYGIYGSTPKLVIQGVNIPASANYSNSSIFNPYTGQTSSFLIQVTAFENVGDSISVEVNISAVDTHSMTTSSLFVAVAEDTIFYNAPNGEDLHFDVFRRAFTPVIGEVVSLPPNGQTITYNGKVKIHSDWNLNRIFPYAILQETSSKSVIQFDKGNYLDNISSSGPATEESYILNSNYIDHTIMLKGSDISSARIFTLDGRLVKQVNGIDQRIDVKEMKAGLYILQVSSREKLFTQKIFIH